MKTVLLFLTLSTAALAYAPTQAGSAPLAPDLEARVQRVGKKLRCAVCQGLAITDSPASMARSQLDKVRELVAAGKTDQEIYDYFVERYDEWVLLEPPPKGVNWLVWLGPGIFLVAGLVLGFSQVRRRRSATPTVGDVPSSPAVSEDPYLAKVRAELDR